ncbi:MAG: beta-ketoacyl-ACP synthase III [Verrucomicrobiales bacterium]|nr:ketoacyl-ACP synthase III [Verrucomicrobiae bacterium]MCC6881541.1 ketoacyl-ACP synthase III [Verrucomicrobiales bacterium]
MTAPHPTSSQIPGLRSVRIAGTGSYLPEKVLTNNDLEKMVETSDEWITTRTGIKERRIAAEGELTSHLAAKAGLKALEMAALDPADIDMLIVSTITPDTITPATACHVQSQIGATRAVAFDVSAACSGFLFAMEVAKNAIATGAVRNALIIGAEKLSAFVNWTDRNTCVLFGDGAGAAVLLPSENGEGRVLSCHLGSDGRQAELLHIPGGGAACPITMDNADRHLATLTMQGREVFKHAVNAMRRAAETAIQGAGLQTTDIQLVIPHQANLRIIEAISERLGLASENVFVNLDKYGNTSAAAIAIAMDEANRSGAMKSGDNVLLMAFGAGLTWASAVIRW